METQKRIRHHGRCCHCAATIKHVMRSPASSPMTSTPTIHPVVFCPPQPYPKQSIPRRTGGTDTRNAHVISFICRDDHGRSEQQLRRAIQLLFVLATNILSSLGYGPRDGNIGTQPSFNPSQQCECMSQSRTKDAADSIRPNQINKSRCKHPSKKRESRAAPYLFGT